MPHANFSKLTDQSLWVSAALVVGGFALPDVIRRMVEGDGTDLPNEVYGVAVAAGAFAVTSGRTASSVAAGAGGYTVAKLLERFDVIEPVNVRLK